MLIRRRKIELGGIIRREGEREREREREREMIVILRVHVRIHISVCLLQLYHFIPTYISLCTCKYVV
ncbi:MAG: hypothetical protein MJE68_04385 [Proteobacteria bacterium]|nr:hypothetical protein [Pseudomonadota bacterium]